MIETEFSIRACGANNRNSFSYVTNTIKASLKRVDAHSLKFGEFQRGLHIVRGISLDVRTRFDSTSCMLDSVLHNERILKQMQECRTNDGFLWPVELHLSKDDF